MPISLTNSSSEAQQTKSFGVIINGDRQKSSLRHRTIYGGKAISNKYVFSFFTIGGYNFRIHNCNKEFIPNSATEKARLPIFSLV